jgi:RNA polymerase sigma-70 factor, ECF subfamily
MDGMPADIGSQLIELLPRLRRFALVISRSDYLADDLVQGACERALRFAGRFEPGTRFDAWMFKILRNLWLDTIRRTRREQLYGDDSSIEAIAGIDGVADAEARLTLASVRTAIAELPDEQREIVFLICVEDLAYREVAEMFDIPVGTVMSRLARARVRLKRAAGIETEETRSSSRPGRTA